MDTYCLVNYRVGVVMPEMNIARIHLVKQHRLKLSLPKVVHDDGVYMDGQLAAVLYDGM